MGLSLKLEAGGLKPRTGEHMPIVDASQLRTKAIDIWRAGVEAVLPSRLMQQWVQCDPSTLTIAGERFEFASTPRVVVIGGGKAGAGMVAAFEAALSRTPWLDKTSGWVNVPDQPGLGNQHARIHLHPARPTGVNEPTAAGVRGTEEILRIVSSLAPDDLCIVLLSGGGSALLPAPIDGISLDDKLRVTRELMRAGVTIQELNLVRKRLSRIKGGGLARAATCRRMIVLVISDVIGDPLDVIASGPAFPDSSTDAEATEILRRVGAADPVVVEVLNATRPPATPSRATVNHYVIGNNRTAVEAAVKAAETMGFQIDAKEWDRAGVAHLLGVELAQRLDDIRQNDQPGVHCVISGGEPVIEVSSVRPLVGLGGRNQELALAALESRWRDGFEGICLVSGGTDGEDGPTSAAGGIADQLTYQTALASRLNPWQSLVRHDSFPFLDEANGLLTTGLTGTNVMDLRVGLSAPPDMLNA